MTPFSSSKWVAVSMLQLKYIYSAGATNIKIYVVCINLYPLQPGN